MTTFLDFLERLEQDMKRADFFGMDDFDFEDVKKVRSEPPKKFELRLLVTSKAAGALIGKGGDYVKMLREMHDATFFIPDSTPERVCNTQVHLYNLQGCVRDMLIRLNEDDKEDDEIELRVIVHQSHAGAIIGYNGENVFMLKNKMGARLKVYKDCCPNSTDRVVAITTAKINMPMAIKVLADFMTENPVKGVQKPYDAINYDARLAPKYGGYLVEGQEVVYRKALKVDEIFPMSNDAAKTSFADAVKKPPREPEVATTIKVMIPSKLGGYLVGKGGTSINRIRAESSAKIDIDQTSQFETSITIAGDLSNVHKALYLIQQRVLQSGANVQLNIRFDYDTTRADSRQG